MNKLAIYCRTSRDNGETHDSVETQAEIGIQYANKNGLSYEVYIDEGISGAGDFFKRPAFVKMVSEIDDELITHVWVLDNSRLEREPSVKFFCTELFKKKNVVFYIQTSGLVDYEDFNGEFIGNILSVTNKHFVELTAFKVKLKLEKNANEGKVHGTPAYGYKKDENGKFAIDEQQSEVIKTIFRMSSEGNGAHTIAEYMNKKGILTSSQINSPNGFIKIVNKYTKEKILKKKSEIVWTAAVVGKILKSTLYFGERIFRGNIYTVPSIITNELFDQVQDQLKKNKNYSQNGTTHNYLLKGLIKCGKCGKNYVGRFRKNKPNSFYICASKDLNRTNCGNESIEIKKIEGFIWERVVGSELFIQILQNEFNFDSDNEHTKVSKLMSEKALLQKDLDNFHNAKGKVLKLYQKDLLNDSEVENEIRDIEKNKSKIQNQLTDIENKLNYINNKHQIISDYQKFQKKLSYFENDLDFKSKKYITNFLINDIKIEWDNEHQLYLTEVKYNYFNEFMRECEKTTLDKEAYVDWAAMLNGRNSQSTVQVPWSKPQS